MAGAWTKITVVGKTKNLDDITAVMSMLDNGLMIEDYSDFSLNGMYGELVDESILNADRDTVRVSLFVPEERSAAEYKEFIETRLAALGIESSIELDGINEDDWAESWKQYYKPVPLGRVTIVPAWEKYEAREDEIVVRMDPGMAFGTGTHETTRLVIRLMQDELRGGERVLDVGTGSGILSICASKMGAKWCNAYDIDPVAVKVARDNALSDGCTNITVGVSDLLRGVDLSCGKYDFCVANIVADIIIRMLPDIKNYLREGAPLILSGIIGERADEVRTAVLAEGFTVEREITENDWVGMLVRV
ncbi:MAG: 50S ribosomal protein L11 methyltransferase [Ruminococcaceae bacterium]|nr:50S ribosomal protein L11 methyltransferase [Oscillospiraceae bacterium]